MEQDQVKRVLIPNDPGFADGGGIEIFLVIMRFFDWIIHPLRTILEKKAAREFREDQQQTYIREGKNPDGSYYQEFPSLCSLAEVLAELGYAPSEMSGINQEQLRTRIAALSGREVTDAIRHCQVSRW